MTTIVSEDFGFTEVATGGASNRGRVKRVEDVQPHGADFFTSLYGHAEDFANYVNDPNTGKGVGSCRGYAGAVKPGFVPFDIDHDDLNDSLRYIRILVRRLHEDYGVPKDVLRTYFSGSKGFHGEIPGECFGGFDPALDAPEKVKQLALKLLDGMETDEGIYDRNRLWRHPNTINGKKDRLYKIPLSYDEVMGLSVNEIKELARKPRNVEYATPEPVPALVSLKEATNVTLRDETPKITDEQTENLAAVIQEFMPPVGDRHLYARALAGYLLPRLKKPRTRSVMLDAWEGADADTIRRVEDHVNDTAEKWMNDEPFEGGPTLEERAPGILAAFDGVLKTQTSKPPRRGLLAGAVPLGELMREGIEPPDESIPGVLLEGRIHQVFCGPGKGKSWLALWMAVQCVNRGLRVLYLDKENGARIIRNRLVALGADPAKVDANLVYVPFPSLDLEPDAVQDYINSLEGFSLVIFDSWINYLAAAGLDENSNGDLARWSTTFCAEARKRNISVLLLDHVGKDGNGSRGASRKLDEMDVSWELRTLMPFDREQAGIIQLRRKKDREAWLSPTVEFEIGGDPFVMKRLDGFEVEEPDSIKNTLKAIEGFGADGAKFAEWLKATDGTGRTQLTEARKELLADGRVVKSGGTYFAAQFSPGAQPDLSPEDLVRDPKPDQTGLVADNAESGLGMGESRSGGGAGLDDKSSPQRSPVRATSLSGGRAGLVGPDNGIPDVLSNYLRTNPNGTAEDFNASHTKTPVNPDVFEWAKSSIVDASLDAQNPDLWGFVQSLPAETLDPLRADVEEFRERYGPAYRISTPQQLMYTYLRDGYAKPKFRVKDGERVLVGLVGI